jgi:GTP-binding protein EngB required for normal cell division
LTVPVAPRRAGAPGIDDALSVLLGLPADLLSERTRRDLADARERRDQGRCNLVVLGEFKRGKSTLVNALLGRPLLPTGVLPLTSVVTVVREGQRDRLVVEFADGRTETHAVSELPRYATEAENPGNELGVELTTVETPSAVLEGGIQLVDTPGVGSVHAHNTDTAHAFVARTDAAIVVLSADQPLSAQERELLASVGRIAGRVLVVLNRIDLLDAGDRASAVRFVERAVASTATDDAAVMVVSARDGTGIETLRRWIGELPRTDNGRWAVSEDATRRALARASAEARTAVNVELAALDLPPTQLDERAAAFAHRVESLEPAREAASAVLDRGIARLLRECATEPLRVLAVESAPRLLAELRDETERSGARAGRELRAVLTAWVDDTVHRLTDETAVRIESDIRSGLADLVARYAVHVDEILADLADGVAEAFGERPSWVAPAIDVGDQPRLRYKLRDEDEALGAALSALRAAVPGSLGRRLVRREQEARLHSMVDRHAGRLREQVAQRTTAAGRHYDTELRRVVDEAAEGVETRIARARADVEQGAERVSARRAALLRSAAACASVARIALAGQQRP